MTDDPITRAREDIINILVKLTPNQREQVLADVIMLVQANAPRRYQPSNFNQHGSTCSGGGGNRRYGGSYNHHSGGGIYPFIHIPTTHVTDYGGYESSGGDFGSSDSGSSDCGGGFDSSGGDF